MKLPKAKKLPSGNWRIQIQIDGDRYSITGKTKTEAQEKVKLLFAGIKSEEEKKTTMTVGKAIDKYLESVENTLSPATMVGYKNIRKNHLKSIMNVNLTELTEYQIQIAIGEEQKKGISPKSIRNYSALLSKVLSIYRPSFHYNIVLPQKEHHEIQIPTEEDLKKILKEAKGTRYELPILLGAWLGLRASEIRGLKLSDIQNGRMHVQRAVVQGPDGPVEKLTKTYSGDRWLPLPKEIEKLIPGGKPESYICPIRQNVLLKAFQRFCRQAGVPKYRFHDLRHFAASEAHALGIPDKYVMARMGHATDNMLKTVYQHTMSEKEDEFNRKIDQKLEELYNGNEGKPVDQR